MRAKKLSQKRFETIAGLSNGYINSLRQAPTATKLQSILSAFPDLNQQWLLTGEGKMLIDDEVVKGGAVRPFFGSLPVSAGRVEQYPDILNCQPTGFIDIPQTHGAEFFFPVIGMSMKPTIDEGEVIGVTHIDSYETTNPDRVYMIVTRDNERMIKRILHYNKEEETITLGSDNPNYPDSTLNTDLVVDIYKVVFHMKIETL
jgi:hypothetical protein